MAKTKKKVQETDLLEEYKRFSKKTNPLRFTFIFSEGFEYKIVFRGAFEFRDTIGFPYDMTYELCKEKGFEVDWLEALVKSLCNVADVFKYEQLLDEILLLEGKEKFDRIKNGLMFFIMGCEGDTLEEKARRAYAIMRLQEENLENSTLRFVNNLAEQRNIDVNELLNEEKASLVFTELMIVAAKEYSRLEEEKEAKKKTKKKPKK